MNHHFWNYSNGWGHLIITIFFAALGAVLILYPNSDATSRGIGVTLIMTASGAWFIPGAAKQVAEVTAKKASPQGIQGIQGVKGEPGETGEQGAQGPPASG